MDVYLLFSIITLFHAVLYYVDHLSKGNQSLRLQTFFKNNNISINLFQLKWSTTICNRFFAKIGNWKSSFWNVWFTAGAWFTVLLILPSIYLLFQTLNTSLVNLFHGKITREAALQPVLPGVNLPSSEIIFYIITLFICSVIHEAGHALAAVRQNVSLLGFGLFLFFVIPAAFVDLPARELTSLTPRQQLKIYCGGVWHNVALASLSYFLLISLPYLAVPFYSTGNGVQVLAVYEGAIGLDLGDHITFIDDCFVKDSLEWRNCLLEILQQPPKGFCVRPENLETGKYLENSECCPKELQASHLCFRSDMKTFRCLRARKIAELSSSRCSAEICVEEEICLFPLEEDRKYENTTKLIQIKRENSKDVLFFGHPADLYSSVDVSSYIPRLFFSPKIINFIENLLKYLVSFSAGLAVLNVVPSFALDGQHIARVLCLVFLPARFNTNLKEKISKYIVWVGSVLLFANIVFGVLAVFKT